MSLLPLVPLLFFLLTIILGFKDNSFQVFRKYGIPLTRKHYGYFLPLKEINHNIQNTHNHTAKKELMKCAVLRKLYYTLLVFTFLSVIIVSFFN